MSRITQRIGLQGFELIGERIAEILADELENQVLSFGVYEADVEVYRERAVPINGSELAYLNVSLATGTLDGDTPVQSNGTYTFFIDGYYRAKSSQDDDGDTLASLKLQRLLGLCRAILSDPEYQTLGFAAPYIGRRLVKSIAIRDPLGSDTASVMMGRLPVEVLVPETVNLITPTLISGYETTVRVEETELGYKYSST